MDSPVNRGGRRGPGMFSASGSMTVCHVVLLLHYTCGLVANLCRCALQYAMSVILPLSRYIVVVEVKHITHKLVYGDFPEKAFAS